MLRRRGGLLRQHDFRHLWAADALSQFGSRISLLAVPLLALTVLGATPFQVALLTVCERAGILLFSLPVGAWADRLRCRPLLVGADLGRFVLLGSIPVAAAFDLLSLVQLYVVLVLMGIHTAVFDVAHQTYLPRLVAADDLVEGNAKLAANMSVAAVGGAGIGGYLIQLLTAPYAEAVDALSYLWSAIWLRGIRTAEARPERTEQRRLRQDIGDGLGYLFGQPILRAIALNVATVVLFQSAIGAITIVFLVREIGLGPAAIGLLSMIGLLAAVVASMATSRIADRLGTARTMLAASVLLGFAFLLLPLTKPGAGLIFFVASGALSAFTIIVLVVLQASARQQLCPEDLRGRVAATMNMLSWGMMPIGALIGGSLAGVLGLRGTIAVCAAGVLTGAAWPICSPLRSLRDVPLSPPTGRRSPEVAAPVHAGDAGPAQSSPHGRTGPRHAAGSGR